MFGFSIFTFSGSALSAKVKMIEQKRCSTTTTYSILISSNEILAFSLIYCENGSISAAIVPILHNNLFESDERTEWTKIASSNCPANVKFVCPRHTTQPQNVRILCAGRFCSGHIYNYIIVVNNFSVGVFFPFFSSLLSCFVRVRQHRSAAVQQTRTNGDCDWNESKHIKRMSFC